MLIITLEGLPCGADEAGAVKVRVQVIIGLAKGYVKLIP